MLNKEAKREKSVLKLKIRQKNDAKQFVKNLKKKILKLKKHQNNY